MTIPHVQLALASIPHNTRFKYFELHSLSNGPIHCVNNVIVWQYQGTMVALYGDNLVSWEAGGDETCVNISNDTLIVWYA